MFGLPQSAEYASDMKLNFCQTLAPPERGDEQTFDSGLSSNYYGAGTTMPRRSQQAGAMSWSSIRESSPHLQDGFATEKTLYTKALQIAALESLANALDYSSLGSTVSQLPHTSSPSTLPQFSWLPQSADMPPTQQTPVHFERTPHPHAAVHDLLASATATQRQPVESLQTMRPHWANPSWHPKASVPSTAGGAASKGTGVFLPCLYDEPHMPTKALSRSHSGCSYASKESTSPNSELSRIDSSFSCQSSETDCSYIAAHGLSFHSKFPAGDARRVVGSKIGSLPGKRVF
ncbi:hypothetical protein ABBQ38_003975 [Trebouxia sp. C0009 RCD-2024]